MTNVAIANNKELASKIVELVGGKDNIKSATNCMTRV
ncbi:PTS transporter subunit EIIB [Natronincola peptidivorans]|nr:PTS transporter subunit EIIB [Natronincola peptidivorans]